MTSPSREAQDAAWKVYRKELGDTRNWTVSESATYRGFFNHGWQAAIQHARDVAVKACEEQADHKEQAKADAASRAAKDETSQLMRLQHWSTVSTYNAGIRRCADAIKEALK